MNLTGKRLPLLYWLPDECFYSVCSRQHILWGNQSPRDTLSFIFGNDTKSFSHDFPSSLGLLSDCAKSVWGHPQEIITAHTISPIFFPFQSSQHVQELKHALIGSNIGSIKYRLGLVTGRFGGEHPLKACMKCMAADQSDFGSKYWHLSHQIPGVTTCPVHGILLSESNENRQWSRGLQWLIPDELTLRVPAQSVADPATLAALQSMSDSAVALWKLGTTCRFDLTTVAQVYKEAFSNLGGFQKARDAAADCFSENCAKLKEFPPFTALPTSRRQAIGFIAQMTRKPRGSCHPLKHLTLIWWLFGSLESFVKSYQQALNQQKLSASKRLQNLIPADTIAVAYSNPRKINGTPKPKKLHSDLKKQILGALVVGSSKKEACDTYGISISTVNRLLRLNPEIDQQFKNIVKLKQLEEQRNLWTRAVNKSPNASANLIKRLVPSVYAWLYRNDRLWLFSQTGSLPSGRIGNYVAIDWDDRDENLCGLVKKAFTACSGNCKKVRKRDLYQMVPNLFSSLEQKLHYPKTRQLLSEILQ